MKKLLGKIEKEASKNVPGFLYVLNNLCLKNYSRKCTELLLLDPEKLMNIIIAYTNDNIAARTIAKLAFIKPLLFAINNTMSKDVDLDSDPWVELLINAPNTFREKILKIIENID